ncbi:MAG: tetratricopeptide repeat protein [Anaerolineae bacterium]
MSSSPPPSAPSRASAAHNIPQPLTRFIGREREIADGLSRLGRARLVTISGPGGAGKTRLAREISARIADANEVPVWWVELAPITDPALVPQIVASVLGLREPQGQSWTEALTAELKPRKLLLVLDGCEHLIEACARLIGALLRAASELRCLIASQEPLGIIGESVLSIPPLGLPDPHHLPNLDDLSRYEAVQLFADRAAIALPGFTLDAHNAPVIAQICARLDGIPLAIELAASRVRLLTVEQIAARLDDRFRLLSQGARTALPRHQTLRAAIEWSYGLLSPAEQAALRRAAAFAGHFDLDAAERVIADDGGVGSETALAEDDILDLLARLVDKSLLVAAEDAPGAKRFHLLDSLRHYALEQWQRPQLTLEADTTRRRHFAYYLDLALEAERHLNGPDQARWLKRIEAEGDNFRAALAWSRQAPDLAQPALQLAATLAVFAYRRGNYTEAREQVDAALRRWPLNDGVRARALRWAGVLADQQGDLTTARAMLEESLALYKELGETGGMANVLHNLGRLASRRADYATARPLLEAALALRRELGAERDSAISLSVLGYIASAQGDYSAAQRFYEESLALHRRVGDPWGAANALLGLGEVARSGGRYEDAAQRYAEALQVFHEVGDAAGIAMAQHNLGYVALHSGDLDGARRAFQDSLAASVELRQTDMIAFCLAGLAAVAAAAGKMDLAGQMFGATDAILAANGVAFAPADRLTYELNVALWRAALGEAAADAAWAEGRQRSLEDVLALALAVASDASARSEGGTAESGQDQSASASRQRRADMGGQDRVVLQLVALGVARVIRDAKPLTSAEGLSAKARELLFYLATHPARSMQQIGADLWPDASRQGLRTAFHNTLHVLRRALGGREWVTTDADGYTLNHDLGYWYDVAQFRALASATGPTASDAAGTEPRLREALGLYQGDFLGELDAEWIAPLRSELRLLYRDAALALGHYLTDGRRYTEGADVYRALIARQPYVEEAHRELMRCLSRGGERSQAVRVYQELAGALARDMGIAPAPETRRLLEQIRNGEEV